MRSSSPGILGVVTTTSAVVGDGILQVTTLRERLLKLAVWVERSARRMVLHMPLTFPWLPTWRQVARAVGATS